MISQKLKFGHLTGGQRVPTLQPSLGTGTTTRRTWWAPLLDQDRVAAMEQIPILPLLQALPELLLGEQLVFGFVCSRRAAFACKSSFLPPSPCSLGCKFTAIN